MDEKMTRRGFLKTGALAVGAVAAYELAGLGGALAAQPGTAGAATTGTAAGTSGDSAQVFFTRDISVAGLLKLYAKVNQGMTGKVGIKLHTGEPHGPNLLPIELIKGLQATIPNSSIVECNVLYPSPRQHTETHREVIKTNGFDFCPVDIMDAEGDVMLPIPGMRDFFGAWMSPRQTNHPYTPGVHLMEIAVGKNLLHYDSLLVYTHFKGHPMGGFGGSLKNIAIGCASGQVGKRQIHGEGWSKGPLFLERMVESGKGVAAHFGPRITYINVLKNLSVDCDCVAKAAKPTMGDIGIVASTDILAVDKASVDLVYAQPGNHKHDLVERIESRTGTRQLEYMKTLGMGNDRYELVMV
ncbi:MAG: DUF362 domain-containing protein [Desulfovibrio sp.]|jgi:uncharacterized Fe-S center protein